MSYLGKEIVWEGKCPRGDVQHSSSVVRLSLSQTSNALETGPGRADMLHLVVLAIHCVQSHLSTSLVSRSIGYNDARQFVDVERTVSACAVDEMQPGVCDEVKSLNKERCRRVSSQQSFVHAACIVNPVLPIIDTIIFSSSLITM